LLGGEIMWRIVIVLMMVGLCANTAVALTGSGTQEDPWRIQSLADFDQFVADPNYWAGHTRLETDVNLTGRTYSTAVIAPDTDASAGHQGTKFTGVFDGSYQKIINLTIDDSGAGSDYVGLFGCISGETGQISNLGLEGGSVSGGRCVGGLVGCNDEGTVSNCYSTGDVNGTGNYVGGLVGWNIGSISNCYSTSSVSGTAGAVGGLIGYDNGSVSNCYSTGDVSGNNIVGGLMGVSDGVSFSKCYAVGSVSGDYAVGGLVGFNYRSISNGYSTGSVSGENRVGGLLGRNEGSISNCYSTGSVSGTWYVGGIVGENYHHSSVSNCFWDTDTQTHGVTVSIGLNQGTVTNVAGLPTPQMQTKSTFTSATWDFVGETANGTEDIWTIHEGIDYPKFVWKLVNFVGWYEVDFLDFAFFANRWLDSNCGGVNDCEGTDLDFSDQVDWADLQIFCDHWLEATGN